jgi:hypothetical protein
MELVWRGVPSIGWCRTSYKPIESLPVITIATSNSIYTVVPSRQIRQLGVIFDESLNFIPHARDAAEGMKALGKICFLRHPGKGISCHVANHLVFAAILPKMHWASPVWWIGSSNIISTLQTTYNAAARWITGLPINTRIQKLLICANLPPLEIYFNYLSTRYAIRLLFLPTNLPLSNKPKEDKNAQHLPGLQRVMYFISGWTSIRNENRLPEGHYQINQLQPPIHMEKSKDVTRVHRQWISSLPDQPIVLYTDGSKLDNGKVCAGWAIYCVGNCICKNPRL